MKDEGHSILAVVLSSTLIYAGSLQVVMVSLMKSGVPLITIALMTLAINSRMAFYGVGFVEEFKSIAKDKKSIWKYPYMALTLTDETYSILCSTQYYKGIDKHKAEFYILLLSHCIWIIGSVIGAVLGDILTLNTTGIDFSATAFFITIVVTQWMKFGSKIPAITGFLCSIVFYFILGPNNFILPALSVSLIVLVFLKDRIQRQLGGAVYE